MKLKLEIYSALCATSEFEINGVKADYNDFGEKYDRNEGAAEEYCCGDMHFEPKLATQEVLDRYKITVDEYNSICKELDKLSFGSCGWCI